MQASSAKSVESTEDSSTNGTSKVRKRKANDDDSNTKRQKSDDITPAPRKPKPKHDPSRTVFISNLSPHTTEEDLQSAFPNADFVNLISGRKGVSKRYAYVQLPSEEDARSALTRDREPLKSRPMFISKCKAEEAEEKPPAFKYATGVEPNKLFVRGLPIKCSREDVEQLFKPHGCTEVRLITHRSGRPKGLAYVEFPDGEAAKGAMRAKDQSQVGEHTISVAISAPPPKRERGGDVREPVRHARSRLQVPLVPRVLQAKAEGAGRKGDAVPKSNDDFRKMLLKQ